MAPTGVLGGDGGGVGGAEDEVLEELVEVPVSGDVVVDTLLSETK